MFSWQEPPAFASNDEESLYGRALVRTKSGTFRPRYKLYEDILAEGKEKPQ
jgi:hypothetical protein